MSSDGAGTKRKPKAGRGAARRAAPADDVPVRGPIRKRSPRKPRPRKNQSAPPAARTRGVLGGWFRRLGLFGLGLGAAPFALMLLYGSASVHPVSTLMLRDALTGHGYQRDWVPLDEFPDALLASVLASEDGRFCAHSGVDWDALGEMANAALAGGSVRGASTITMQTVKNLFLPSGRSYVRKAIEVPLALFADLVWGKRRTLEIYLNVAEWAPGHFGASAGARAWFGKDVRRLTRAEAARLAVTLPNPYLRNPADPGPRQTALARLNQRRAAAMRPYMRCLNAPET